MKFRLCSVIASFSLARAKASARKRQQDTFPSRSGASSNEIWNDTYDCKIFRFTIVAEFSINDYPNDMSSDRYATGHCLVRTPLCFFRGLAYHRAPCYHITARSTAIRLKNDAFGKSQEDSLLAILPRRTFILSNCSHCWTLRLRDTCLMGHKDAV